MKTQVRNHDYHLGAMTLLISISLVVLIFGVYKTLTVSNKAASYTSHYVVNRNIPVLADVDENLLLTTHNFVDVLEEPVLEVEDWMLNDKEWLTSESTLSTLSVEEHFEETLPLEDWMTDPDSWLNQNEMSSEAFMDESEPELELEAWMLDDENWLSDDDKLNKPVEEEYALQIEPWMLSVDSWEVPVMREDQLVELSNSEEEPLQLQAWMLNCCTWVPESYSTIEIYEFSQRIKEDALALENWMLDDESWVICDKIPNDYPVS